MEENKTSWEYKPDGSANSDISDDGLDPENIAQPASRQNELAWEAPEYIEHPHGLMWYAALFLSTAIFAAGVYLISGHDKVATVIVALLGVIVGVFAAQKPGIAKYEINDSGLIINRKTYKYRDYKSFSIIDEGAFYSVNLIPLKRFMPPIAAYFKPDAQKKIMDAVGNYLPYEERQLDSIERLSRRLRL